MKSLFIKPEEKVMFLCVLGNENKTLIRKLNSETSAKMQICVYTVTGDWVIKSLC